LITFARWHGARNKNSLSIWVGANNRYEMGNYPLSREITNFGLFLRVNNAAQQHPAISVAVNYKEGKATGGSLLSVRFNF
jgi:hypothetical protein